MYDSEDEAVGRGSSYHLHNAAEAGDVDLLRELLRPRLLKEGAPAAMDAEFDPAAEAAKEGEEDEEEEEDEGPDVDARDEYGCTPLHLALLSGEPACAQLLLEAGAEAEYHLEGQPALHLALASGALAAQAEAAAACVRLLLAAGSPPDALDEMRRTPLHVACGLGLLAAAEALLAALLALEEGRALLEARDRSGATPLSAACRGGHAPLVRALLAAGAAAEGPADGEGRLALHWAAHRGCAASAAALLAALEGGAGAAALRRRDGRGRTAAEEAARRGHAEAAALLSPPGAAPPAPPGPLPAGLTHIIAPPLCGEHRTAAQLSRGAPDPPPENARRLDVLLHRRLGLLRCAELGDGRHALLDEACARLAERGDVLRCHEWPYLLRLQRCVQGVPDAPGVVGSLDGDTDVSAGSLQAALAAAGSVCEAVDRVLAPGAARARSAFCAVRPPGHHAGPFGPVSPSEPPGSGSHGFCLLNNVAIGAAYALCVHRAAVRRVAIVDFDVHHGNGTQACVEATAPGSSRLPFSTAAAEGLLKVATCKPWLGDGDEDNVFFASVHGFGAGFYPGTGPSSEPGGADAAEWAQDGVVAAAPRAAPPGAPRVINVGMTGCGPRAARGAAWRRVWAGRVLPQLAAFAPDLLLVSAGFDAHAKDAIQGPVNLGVTEADYEWLTEQLVAVANSSGGRLVSVLEGGYRVQGGPASAFARSVQAHVRALALPSAELWDGAAEEAAVRAAWAERAAAQAAAQAEAEAQLAAAQAAYAAAAAAAVADPGGEAAPPALVHAPPTEEDGRRAKRARPSVDYAELQRKLDDEERARREAA